MTVMIVMTCVAALLLAGGVNGFIVAPSHRSISSSSIVVSPMAGSSSDLPYGPPPGNQNSPDQNGNSAAERDDGEDNTGGATLKGNRFSKHAPDSSLDTADFKQQLMENMKADLERRRSSLPNRGSQPAKTYLDNL